MIEQDRDVQRAEGLQRIVRGMNRVGFVIGIVTAVVSASAIIVLPMIGKNCCQAAGLNLLWASLALIGIAGGSIMTPGPRARLVKLGGWILLVVNLLRRG